MDYDFRDAALAVRERGALAQRRRAGFGAGSEMAKRRAPSDVRLRMARERALLPRRTALSLLGSVPLATTFGCASRESEAKGVEAPHPEDAGSRGRPSSA